MKTDSIGGRKFIAFLICMATFIGILFAVATKGQLTGDAAQSFLFYLIVIQAVFFGGNIGEKFIMNKNNQPK